jgi:hypothetical protein
MPKKKKKGGKKKKEKKEGEDDEEEKENPFFKVVLPEYGWIRLELRLCDAPSNKFNTFRVVMRSSDRIMEVKKKIIDFHGRVENVHIYNKDPYPPRVKKDNFRMTQKPRVPPFRLLPKLNALKVEKADKEAKEAARRKKIEEEGEESDEGKNKPIYNPYEQKEDPHKFDIIDEFDYPEDTITKEPFVEYDEHSITLYEIF